MSEAQSSDAMNRLVKFLVCLAVFGAIIALLIYFLVVLPNTPALQVPLNFVGPGPRQPTIIPPFFIS